MNERKKNTKNLQTQKNLFAMYNIAQINEKTK